MKKNNIAEKIKKIPVWPTDYVVKDNELWLVHGKLNALFRYSFSLNKLYYEGCFPGLVATQPFLFTNLVSCNNSLFISVINDKRIGYYDSANQKISIINSPSCTNGEIGYAQGTVLLNNDLYFFPSKGNGRILNLDTETKKCITDDAFDVAVPEYFETNTCGVKAGEGSIIFTVSGRNEFIWIDVVRKSITIHKIPYETMAIAHSVAVASDKLYFLAYYSNVIYEFDPEIMEAVSNINIHKKNAILQGIKNRYLFIDSFDGDGAEVFDTKNGRFLEFEYEKEKRQYPDSYDYNVGIIRESDDGKVYYYNRMSNEIIEMESKTTWKPELDEIEYEKMLGDFKKLPKPGLCTEGFAYGLEEFLWM